jgi:hypothetical protein
MKKDIYLIARHFKVPRNPNQTFRKNFGSSDAAWQWNEEVSFKQKINKSDNASASVILGLHHKEVIRSTLNPTASFNELYDYFYKNGYKDYLDKIRKAEEMVAQAVEEAMKEMKDNMKDTNTDPTTWHFPKAEDFETKEFTPNVYGALPTNPEYIGMTAEEMKSELALDAMGFTPINLGTENA